MLGLASVYKDGGRARVQVQLVRVGVQLPRPIVDPLRFGWCELLRARSRRDDDARGFSRQRGRRVVAVER